MQPLVAMTGSMQLTPYVNICMRTLLKMAANHTALFVIKNSVPGISFKVILEYGYKDSF